MRPWTTTLWIIFLSASLAHARPRPVAPELQSFPPLTASDRILILAPHEDDEVLGAGGLIQQALKENIPIRVVYLTYGDHNEWAFLMYRKRLWLTPRINRQMGILRRQEASRATRHLGLSSDQLVFLGYPDHGTLEIWKESWRDAPPFYSLLTNTTAVPYLDAAAYAKPYKGEAVLADLEAQIGDFKPTRIFVTHPLDSNPDHRALYLYMQAALLALPTLTPTPTIYCYPVHLGAWPRPLGFYPSHRLPTPALLYEDPSPWFDLALTPDEVQLKAESIRLNRTQMSDHGYWLIAFARLNELFTTPTPILLSERNWSESRGVVSTDKSDEKTDEPQVLQSTGNLTGIIYREAPEALVIQASLRRPMQRELGLSLYVFPSRQGVPFGDMAKLHLVWRWKRLRMYNNGFVMRTTDVQVLQTPETVTFQIPWSVLGDPDHLFAQVQGTVSGLSVAQTGWQLIARSLATSPAAVVITSGTVTPAIDTPTIPSPTQP